MSNIQVPVPTVPVIDARVLGTPESHGRSESAIDDEDLPPLAPVVSSHSHRAMSTVRHGAGVVSHRTPADIGAPAQEASAGTYELHHLPPYLSEQRARRPSAIRTDTVDTIGTLYKDTNASANKTDGKDTAPPSPGVVGGDAELGGDFSYPPSASATITNLPQLSFVDSTTEISEAQRNKFRMLEWVYFGTMAWAFFLEGWNDGTVGPLMPVIQRDYGIGFAIAALLFVFNCLGFISGAMLNVWLNEKLGFGKIVFFGSLMQLASYAMQAPQPPFPVMVLGFTFAGFGMSLQNAQGNGFVGSMKDHQTIKINVLHASYGLGAFMSPLAATHFSETPHWGYHYIISCGFAVANSVALALVFRFRTQEALLASAGQLILRPQRTIPHGGAGARNTGGNLYKEIFAIRAVHFMAIFALIYIGVEVTVGGWIVTFIIRERDGGPNAGYISSGFFGGLTLGRLVLISVSRKIGEHRAIFVYTILCIALEITVWFVPNIFGNAVAVSIIGMMLGPLFPIIVGHCSRIFPHWLLTGSIGWISGIGMSGSALLPFITGILSSKYGIRSLQPFLVAMMCTMVGLWALVPKSRRHID